MIILPILIASLTHFYLKGWENVLFELGSERVTTKYYQGSTRNTGGKVPQAEIFGIATQCAPSPLPLLSKDYKSTIAVVDTAEIRFSTSIWSQRLLHKVTIQGRFHSLKKTKKLGAYPQYL